MKTFIVRNTCLLAEALVVGYVDAAAAIAIVEKDMRERGEGPFCVASNFSAEEVTQPSILWRELEEE